jgi:hypothetical protein
VPKNKARTKVFAIASPPLATLYLATVFDSSTACLTASMTWACHALGAAMTPLLPLRVRPSEKSSGLPFMSDTTPPASSTRSEPDEWSLWVVRVVALVISNSFSTRIETLDADSRKPRLRAHQIFSSYVSLTGKRK